MLPINPQPLSSDNINNNNNSIPWNTTTTTNRYLSTYFSPNIPYSNNEVITSNNTNNQISTIRTITQNAMSNPIITFRKAVSITTKFRDAITRSSVRILTTKSTCVCLYGCFQSTALIPIFLLFSIMVVLISATMIISTPIFALRGISISFGALLTEKQGCEKGINYCAIFLVSWSLINLINMMLFVVNSVSSPSSTINPTSFLRTMTGRILTILSYILELFGFVYLNDIISYTCHDSKSEQLSIITQTSISTFRITCLFMFYGNAILFVFSLTFAFIVRCLQKAIERLMLTIQEENDQYQDLSHDIVDFANSSSSRNASIGDDEQEQEQQQQHEGEYV
jgi:hypothetical protein